MTRRAARRRASLSLLPLLLLAPGQSRRLFGALLAGGQALGGLTPAYGQPFGSRQGAQRALPDAAFPPSAPDFDCAPHDQMGSGHCQVRCDDPGCGRAHELCRALWPRCRGVSVNAEGTWGTLKSAPAAATAAAAGPPPPPWSSPSSSSSSSAAAGAQARVTCEQACRWAGAARRGGAPAGGRPPDGSSLFVCPSHLRDATHYVISWPFAHFGERAQIAPVGDAAACLPPVPLLYAQLGDGVVEAVAQLGRRLAHGYILVTGQSDYPPSRYARLLADPRLLHWFAQNADIPPARQLELGAPHRLEPVPIGINCFEHGPELAAALRSLRAAPVRKSKLLLVNFGDTHPQRRRARAHFCGPRSAFGAGRAECAAKGAPNRVAGNPQLVPFYRRAAAFKYWVAPPGNGLDCHRMWEAMYLGVVPIVLRAHLPLDRLAERRPWNDGPLPALVVESYAEVTPELLEAKYAQLVAGSRTQLDMRFWRKRLRAVRAEKLAAAGLRAAGTAENKEEEEEEEEEGEHRCWGVQH